MNRVTGIGGIFFKAKDAPSLQAWYKRHLGIDKVPAVSAAGNRYAYIADPDGNWISLYQNLP